MEKLQFDNRETAMVYYLDNHLGTTQPEGGDTTEELDFDDVFSNWLDEHCIIQQDIIDDDINNLIKQNEEHGE